MRFTAYSHDKKTHRLGLPDRTPYHLGLLQVAMAFENRHGKLPDAVRRDDDSGLVEVVVGSRCLKCGSATNPRYVTIPHKQQA